MKYAKAQYLDNKPIVFFEFTGEPWKQEDIEELKKHPEIYATYVTTQTIPCIDNITIPEGRAGNLGPYNDVVYFGNGLYPDDPHNTHTIGIPIEIVLFNPKYFRGYEKVCDIKIPENIP